MPQEKRGRVPQSKARKREYMREYMRLWRSLWGGEGSIVKSDPPNKSVSPFVSERGVVIVNPVSPLLVPVGAFRGSRAAETALAYMTYINARGYTLTDGPPYRIDVWGGGCLRP